MPIISVRIPQLGEGLQEALLVDFLKSPGDAIKRDEPMYTMETDKATTDVESPYDGTLVEWVVETGSVLEIGTEIARMQVAEGVQEMPAGHGPTDTGAATDSGSSSSATTSTRTETVRSGKILIPPKTRRLLKEHGLLDVANTIPAAGSKLMVSDVEAFLAAGGAAPAAGGSSSSASANQLDPSLFESVALPKSQVVLNYRLGRGAKDCVPVTVVNAMNWQNVSDSRAKAKAAGGGPTGFAMACWAVVGAIKNHPKFRSSLAADGKSLQVFHDVNLGIAVALPGDEMVTAVVRGADKMSADEFFEAYGTQVSLAQNGEDQADATTTVTVSNIGKAGMRIGIPAIVAPAVATLAIGEVYQHPVPDGDSFKFQPMVQATLSFDHRIANGVGAANFMNEVKQTVESFSL